METGNRARVEILSSDGIAVTIGFGTRVDPTSLTGLQGRDGDLLFDLVEDILGIVAPHRIWRSFRVPTSLAIASIRSTEWLVEHEAEAPTGVFVRHGEVTVAADGNDLLLGA